MNYNVFYTYRPENTAWTARDQIAFNDFNVFKDTNWILTHCTKIILSQTNVYKRMNSLKGDNHEKNKNI